MTRLEKALLLLLPAIFLGPLLLTPAPLPGSPETGMALARRLLDDLVRRGDTARRHETFLYGQTPEEPAEYSYAVFSRDLKNGIYELDVQIRWKAIPDTKLKKGKRPMEVHLGRLVRKQPI
ncbi:MAG: hypothetical protein U0931_31560 [Vulcanimicrobiota bacterium]